MNRSALFLLTLVAVLIVVAPAAALQFSEPADGASVPAGQVQFAWDESPVLFAITGGSTIELTATSTTLPLAAGSYVATLTNSTNHTASVSFTVTAVVQNTTNTTNTTTSTPTNTTNTTNPTNTSNTTQQTNQLITLSTDAALYEVGASARIRVVVATPETLSLKVQRTGGLLDSYTVNVQQQTDFLYPLTAAGAYTVTATGASTNAMTTFTARNSSLGVAITGDDDGTAGRVTSFGSTVTGGTGPYTYRWQFSDDTSSSGSSVDHVFELPGNYTVTLIVTDSASRTASASRTVEIEEFYARLTVTVLGDNSRLLPNTLVTVSDTRVSRSALTDSYGSVRFTGLSLGNYTVNGSHNYTSVTPIREYKGSTVVALTRDRTVSLTLAVPDNRVVPAPVANTTNTTTVTPPVPAPVAAPVPAPVAAPVIPQPKTAAELSAEIDAAALAKAASQDRAEANGIVTDSAQAALAQARTDAIATIRGAQAGLMRSEARAEIVRAIGIDQRFAAAEAEITTATTPEQVAQILARAPRDVTIMARDTTITRRTASEIKEDVESYIAAIKADDETASSIRYTARLAAANRSITSKRSVVRVTRADASSPETYTVFSRSSPAVPGMTYIEFVPKSIANDVSALQIHGTHEVVDPDPIIRFLQSEYSYYVKGEVEGEPTVVALPSELTAPTGLAGFVSVKLNLQSFENGGLYLGILAIVICGILGGNMYLRRRDADPSAAFEELAELTLGVAESGDFVNANKYLPELERLHTTLPPATRARTQETMSVLRDAVLIDNFKRAESALRESFTLSDHVATAAAFERLLTAHGALPEAARLQRKAALDAAHRALEEHLSKHEAAAPASGGTA